MSKYYKYSKLSTVKFRRIVYYFSHDLTASTTAKLTHVSVRTVNNIYLYIRKIIAKHKLAHKCPITKLSKKEYYIGVKIGNKKKINNPIIFGIFNVDNHIETLILNENNYKEVAHFFMINITKDSIDDIIKQKKKFRNYYGIIDLYYHDTLKSQQDVKESQTYLINSFLGYARNRMIKLKGISSKTFDLHLYETEFRYSRLETKLCEDILALLLNMKNT